jgi:type I restriction enzyme S subunit
MANWQTIKVSQFLKEREGRYDPADSAVQSLKRLNKIDFSGEIHLSAKGSKTDMIIVEPGDLVISGINVSKGALAVYHGDEPITATIHYSSYIFDEQKIDIEYFKRFVKSQFFVRVLKEQVKGGIKTEIKPKHFLSLAINLPDIDSQKEIVAFFNRIENEMSELSGEITHQQVYLKKLRQQILQEAIEGKLTAEWRKRNPELIGGENHASKLIEKIKAQKELLIKEGKVKKDKLILAVTNAEKPFNLPDGWLWCRLNQLVDIQRSITYGIVKMGDEPSHGGVYALRCSDVRFRYIDTLTTRKVSENLSSQYSRTILSGGEILLNVRGTLGGCAITTEEHKGFNIAREVALIVLHNRKLNDYILNVFTSPFFNSEIGKNLRGIAYKGLNLNLLSNFLIPFPPFAEQQAIVERVEKLMAMIDDLEKQVTERKNQSEMLMQAVLREAFEN